MRGDLGILNLDCFNKALLAMWLWKIKNKSWLWQDILGRKYITDKYISGIQHIPGDSQFWTSLLKIKDIFYKFVKKELGDGKNTRFWEDTWVDDKPLKDAYPRIYDICFDHKIKVDEPSKKDGRVSNLEGRCMAKL